MIFVIPLAILGAIKVFFAVHGLVISMAALEAGYKAHRKGEDAFEAAIQAGATKAAALLLQTILRRVC
jgi:hypothetical protein